MMVMGDVKCLHCGFVTGHWVGQQGTPLTVAGLRCEGTGGSRTAAEELVRCGRCAGPVFLDEVSLVTSSYRLRRIRRMREQIAAMDARRDRAA